MGVDPPLVEPPRRWRTAEELVAIGFETARVVMMNEAHDGLRRSRRTREVGRQILPTAHAAGVRHLAMEALFPPFTEHANATRSPPEVSGGYLSQPEMRELIATALDLGWTLIHYEAQRPPSWQPPSLTMADTNWREAQQARNLAAAWAALAEDAKLLVWCGNHHHFSSPAGELLPMGARFRHLAAVEVFAIDQLPCVRFHRYGREPSGTPWLQAFAPEIDILGGVAGFLTEEAPPDWYTYGFEAFLLLDDEVV